jgi:ABC-2 type transport system ATP-binding protein
MIDTRSWPGKKADVSLVVQHLHGPGRVKKGTCPKRMAAEPIIEIDGLSKAYKSREGRIEALKDLTFQVRRGEILGLLGPNGAGKTTAVKLIMGFLSPTQGRIFFQGQPLKVGEPRRRIGYLPESFRPNPNLTVFEYVQFQCALAGDDGDRRRGRAMELLSFVGMDRFPKRKISDLSKGMGQRVGLAQAFAGDPDLLILDEPTSGLDPIGKGEIIGSLLEMRKKGKTIFFCSHILSEVERLCDRIGILVDGRLRFIGATSDFKQRWQTEDLEEAFRQEALCEAS